MAEESAAEPSVIVRREDDFFKYYANSVTAESTAWDLKLVFGQFDSVDNQQFNSQKLSVTMSFGLARLMVFWIESQIIAHEIETGTKVRLRDNVLPPALPPLPPEMQNDRQLVKLHDEVAKLRASLIASME